MFLLTFMNAYGIIFSSYKYHRCTVQNEIWMCVSVLCQRYTRYTGEITWKTTSKTTESTSQNNRLFLKTNPLLLLQKQKQELLQRQQRKLSRKKIFLLVRRTSRPEREAFFSWTGWFLSRDGWLYRRLLRYLGYIPPAARRACTLIWGLAEIRGCGRMLSVPWFKWGSWFHSTRMPPDYSNDFVTNHNRLNCTGSNCFVRVLPF